MKAVGQIDNHRTPLWRQEKQPGAGSGEGALPHTQHPRHRPPGRPSPTGHKVTMAKWGQLRPDQRMDNSVSIGNPGNVTVSTLENKIVFTFTFKPVNHRSVKSQSQIKRNVNFSHLRKDISWSPTAWRKWQETVSWIHDLYLRNAHNAGCFLTSSSLRIHLHNKATNYVLSTQFYKWGNI